VHLGRVIGTVVCSRKVDGLDGVKLLIVQPVDHAGRPAGGVQVAADTSRAGPGDLCYLTVAREAALALDESFVPVDAAILGIVDAVP
jgi:ethanolamine utilization protein EutN